MWCSTRLNFRTTPISFISERLKKCFKHIGPNSVSRRHQLFFTHKDIRYFFQIVNQELENISQCFVSNKLQNKPSQKENIPLLLPKLIINNYEIQRTESIKFLGVLLDENFSWKEHIKYNENKIAKNLGLLFKAKHYLNKRSLLVLYYSFIDTLINYRNIAWGSTNRTNL